MRCGSVGRWVGGSAGRRVGGSVGPEQLPCRVSDFKQSATRPFRGSVKNNRRLLIRIMLTAYDAGCTLMTLSWHVTLHGGRDVGYSWRWLFMTLAAHDVGMLTTLVDHDAGCWWRRHARYAGCSSRWHAHDAGCSPRWHAHDASMLTTLACSRCSLLTTLAAHDARCSLRWLLMTVIVHDGDFTWRWQLLALLLSRAKTRISRWGLLSVE